MSLTISPAAPAATIVPAVPFEPLWRWTVDQYHAMIRAGVLTEDDPVELLDGWVVEKMPKNPAHCSSAGVVRDALSSVLPSGWFVRVQDPVTLATSEPEPDVAVVRGEPRTYAERHPGPEDTALVVEVADSNLRFDRVFKKWMYADAGIAAYWIVNLVQNRVEVHTKPSGSGEQADYLEQRGYSQDEEIPLMIEGREVGRIRVRDLLP
jgi:Uma2 family endonuclease